MYLATIIPATVGKTGKAVACLDFTRKNAVSTVVMWCCVGVYTKIYGKGTDNYLVNIAHGRYCDKLLKLLLNYYETCNTLISGHNYYQYICSVLISLLQLASELSFIVLVSCFQNCSDLH